MPTSPEPIRESQYLQIGVKKRNSKRWSFSMGLSASSHPKVWWVGISCHSDIAAPDPHESPWISFCQSRQTSSCTAESLYINVCICIQAQNKPDAPSTCSSLRAIATQPASRGPTQEQVEAGNPQGANSQTRTSTTARTLLCMGVSCCLGQCCRGVASRQTHYTMPLNSISALARTKEELRGMKPFESPREMVEAKAYSP